MGECSTEYRGLPDANGEDAGSVPVPAALRKVSIVPLVFLIFYEVSGGPFGIEDSVERRGRSSPSSASWPSPSSGASRRR